ncbi:MAG: hydrolase TatD [Sulfuricurvum sp. RIFOXYD2_FULL_44_160]|uniref:Hydrolase TatD n=1 Tax=Sulfuricurvum kujiense TaxID=148813 RepID=A0A2D3WQM7_9BACT|nr:MULTISPECIES: TatD family hydrolase [Sulfuricurvum]OHD91162.1 MAG: hydrolase TatD [Sulfuricurvum sp. RIFOXYD12_FULL_44_77]OHD91860.1 MAG: hydrolase TatD [Sulfuricurvum sp. RIFOXYD2_FULL_44_160]DAB39569.1 MAG TPA: hydrolase TatD [Sulfuricurvum kujiense]
MIIDTHIHLDDERYRDDFDEMIQRAHEAGVEAFIIPGAHPSTLKRAVELCEQYDNIYFAVGVHPYDMETIDTVDFDHYAAHPKCVAIGECGLDYFRLEGSDEEKEQEKRRQDEVFRTHIRFAKKVKKPLIVHIRDASHNAKMILLEEGAGEVGGVLHCYNADDELLSLAKENFYFGIGGVVTFQNAKKLVNILPRIPRDKLLIETDGPYLTPHPHRGSRNESAYTRFIVNKMGELLGETAESIESLTTRNAKTLFGLG